MGTVYLAQQEQPFRRKVALKLIRSSIEHPEVLQRFRSEGQTLARMSHPNIAQVFEAGSCQINSNRPFLAMEYVDGLRIDSYCSRHRLTLRQRLELFTRVCAGAQHAHQKAIIHRDLKPNNILVCHPAGTNSQPIPKIIDFGIAKALDGPFAGDASLTRGRVIGTVAYLSPEAISSPEQELDTRADVYALGLVLYELLAGGHPFTDTTDLVMARKIVETEPPKPSSFVTDPSRTDNAQRTAERRRLDRRTLARALRGDLDWIVLKAIAKDPADRYPSAAELANDISRHLDSRPVVAGPPSTGYRVAKFIARHRAAAAAAFLSTVALIGGFTARTLEADRANQEAQRANQEALVATEVSEFLVELFSATDPGAAADPEITAREILDRGAERIRNELEDQPLVQAHLMGTIGWVYRTLGVYDSSEELLRASLDIYSRAGQVNSVENAEILIDLAALVREDGRYDEAIELLERATPVLDDEPVVLARGLLELSNSYSNLGKFEIAEGFLDRSLAIRIEQFGEDHRDVAATLNNLGNLYFDQRRFDEAEVAHLRGIAIKERILDPNHFYLAQSLNNLGNVYLEQGRLEEASETHARALTIKRIALPADHIEIGVSFHNLGDIAFKSGRLTEAKKWFEQAATAFRNAVGPDHPFLGYSYLGLAVVARDLGDFEKSESLFRRALDIRIAAHGPDHPNTQEVIEEFSTLLASLGREGEAAELRSASATTD